MQKFLFSILILSSGAVLGGFYFNNKRQNIINDLIKTVEDIVDLKKKLISTYEKIEEEISKVNKKVLFEAIREIFFKVGIKSWLNMDFWGKNRDNEKLSNILINLYNNKETEEDTTEDFDFISFDLNTIFNLAEEFTDTLEKLYEKCFKLFRNPFEKYRSEIEKLGYKNIDNEQVIRLISIQEKIYLLANNENNDLKETEIIESVSALGSEKDFIFKDLKLSGELVTDDEEFLSALKKHKNIFKTENSSILTINLDDEGKLKGMYEIFKFNEEKKLNLSLWKNLINLNKTPEEIESSIKSLNKTKE